MKSHLIIVVIYRCSPLESETLVSLNKALMNSGKKSRCFIQDNSPEPIKNFEWEKEFPSLNIKYHHDPTNPGVSKAYNNGANFASEISAKWITLFDQDTKIDLSFISELFLQIEKQSHIPLIAPIVLSQGRIYSPCYFYFGRGFHLKSIEPGEHKLKGINFLNSGLTIRLDKFKEAGGYNDEIQMYFSDFEFIERLKKKSSSFYLLNSSLNHELSDNQDSSLEQALWRFNHYSKGAISLPAGHLSKPICLFFLFLRAFKLVLKFRDITFIKIYWKNIFNV